LSHLGFISFALGLGWTNLAIFHLLAHALFKSSLFISLGMFISLNYHYQDSRYFSRLGSLNPFFSSVILVSESNLFALPFLSGFYSKDYILECLPYSPIGGIFLVSVVYFNVFLTYCYSLRTFLSLVSYPKLTPFNSSLPSFRPFYVSLSFLSFFSIFFGLLFISFFYPPHCTVPLLLKYAPSFILILTLLLSLNFIQFFGTQHFSILGWFLSSIVFLLPLWSSITSRAFYFTSSFYYTFVESGLLNFLVVRVPSHALSSLSSIMAHLLLTSYKLSSSILILTLLLSLSTIYSFLRSSLIF
jgi:NADH:ubiquinone oxidoreductase subunit 5 (subunit L)/multisubunit Na+/H+ antiporter MnhA subunit